jgi:hypothetical protein
MCVLCVTREELAVDQKVIVMSQPWNVLSKARTISLSDVACNVEQFGYITRGVSDFELIVLIEYHLAF